MEVAWAVATGSTVLPVLPVLVPVTVLVFSGFDMACKEGLKRVNFTLFLCKSYLREYYFYI